MGSPVHRLGEHDGAPLEAVILLATGTVSSRLSSVSGSLEMQASEGV